MNAISFCLDLDIDDDLVGVLVSMADNAQSSADLDVHINESTRNSEEIHSITLESFVVLPQIQESTLKMTYL